MYVAKEQREVLNNLSARIWGSESRWRKMMKHPAFRVPDGTTTEVPQFSDYVRKGKTVLKRSTAEAKGLVKSIPEDERGKKLTVSQYREPTPDELFFMMGCVLDEKRVKVFDTHEVLKEYRTVPYIFHVVDFSVEYPWNKFMLKQENTEEYVKNLGEALKELPEDIQEVINAHLIPADQIDEKILSGAFDAVQFTLDCASAFADYNKFKGLYENLLTQVDVIVDSERK